MVVSVDQQQIPKSRLNAVSPSFKMRDGLITSSVPHLCAADHEISSGLPTPDQMQGSHSNITNGSLQNCEQEQVSRH